MPQYPYTLLPRTAVGTALAGQKRGAVRIRRTQPPPPPNTKNTYIIQQAVVRLNEEYVDEQKRINTSMTDVTGYAFATFKTITAAAVSTQVRHGAALGL